MTGSITEKLVRIGAEEAKLQKYMKAEKRITRMQKKDFLQWLIDLAVPKVRDDQEIFFYEIARLIYQVPFMKWAANWAEVWTGDLQKNFDRLVAFKRDAQSYLKAVLDLGREQFPEAPPDSVPGILFKFTTKKVCYIHNGTFQVKTGYALAPEPPSSADSEFGNYYADVLYSTLEGLDPLKVIRACPECHKVFAHLSKKEKVYCSPGCTSRALARKKRAEDPETYRAKQREIMRRKYEEKKKQQLGKNVKINRRPEKGE